MLENTTPLTTEELYIRIVKILEDKKSENIVTIDLTSRSYIADKLVIASGSSTRQVGAIADGVYRELKNLGIKSSLEGIAQCDWVIVDGGDIIVHVFRPEVRVFYNLEKMWSSDSLPSSKAIGLTD